MEMSNREKNIKFVYLGNSHSKSKIGEYPNGYDATIYEGIAKIFDVSSSLSKNNEVVKFGNSKDQDTYILLNPTNNTLFYAITATSYKKEFVVELFHEMEKLSIHLLVDTKGYLNSSGSKTLKTLVDAFQNKKNIIEDLNSDIDKVKIELRESINKQLASNESSERLNDKANKLKDNANMFRGNASALEKKTCMQNFKWTMIIAIIVIALLLVIIVPIIVSSGSGSSNPTPAPSPAPSPAPTPTPAPRTSNPEDQKKIYTRFLY
jgi:hypothetical protein